ncbi:MAG: hypothetical protein Q8S33_25795 [Myxococcales bacterium]|nr:hypothetical protein [Myxococcales bacterium]MDP3503776.1 hypothetical protein [Myxococcales bacterium]
MRHFILGLLFVSCGHLGPGTWFSGGRGGGDSPGPAGPSTPSPSKPIYDDKGCANMSGESGAKIQAGCRSGK